MAVQEPAEHPYQALHAANMQRTMEASSRNRKMAAAALMRLGADCPPEWEDVATEVILHSQYSWTQIARRLGVTRGQAVYRFRRLLLAADVGDGGAPRPDDLQRSAAVELEVTDDHGGGVPAESAGGGTPRP